jgi:hypothetical protein
MSDFKAHLQQLTKCKADLVALKGSPVPPADVSALQNKFDSMAAEVKQYLAVVETVSKDMAAVRELEKKLAPNIAKLNGLLEKMEGDATAAQKLVGVMTGTLAKLPAFKKAGDVVKACYDEVFSLRSKSGVKLKADGNLNL